MKKIILLFLFAIFVIGCKPASIEQITEGEEITQPLQEIQIPERPPDYQPYISNITLEPEYDGYAPIVKRMIISCKSGNMGACDLLKEKYDLSIDV
jgi:hypothetical protein